MKNTDILFTGYYGKQNTGDDAFVEVAAWGSKKYWQKQNFRFLGRQKFLPQTIEPNKGYLLDIPKTFGMQKHFLLKNTEYLISAGGSTIHSELDPSNIKMLALQLKKKSDLKIGAIGVSIGPFKTAKDETAVKKYLDKIDFLAVRDQRSFDFASSLDLPYKPVNAFDLAALLPVIYKSSTKIINNGDLKIIGISVCPVESVHNGGNLNIENTRISHIIELIKSLDRKGNIKFRFFVINGNPNNGDLSLTKKVIEASLPKTYEIIHYQKETKVMWENIATCNFVLATRLHAAVFACFAEIPFMLIEYHRKCTDFLNNVGYISDFMIGDAEFEISSTTERILDWVHNPSDFPTPVFMNEMVQKAFLNFTEINL